MPSSPKAMANRKNRGNSPVPTSVKSTWHVDQLIAHQGLSTGAGKGRQEHEWSAMTDNDVRRLFPRSPIRLVNRVAEDEGKQFEPPHRCQDPPKPCPVRPQPWSDHSKTTPELAMAPKGPAPEQPTSQQPSPLVPPCPTTLPHRNILPTASSTTFASEIQTSVTRWPDSYPRGQAGTTAPMSTYLSANSATTGATEYDWRALRRPRIQNDSGPSSSARSTHLSMIHLLASSDGREARTPTPSC